jgi:hypothetical protein
MTHREAATSLPGQQAASEPRYQCAVCEGIIENLSDEAISSGFDPRIDFFSDECVLICNACTSQLVQANAARLAERRK